MGDNAVQSRNTTQSSVLPKQDNPFELAQYKNLNIPDEPIVLGRNMVDSMINNDEVDDDVKRDNWWIFHKDNVLGFMDTERKQSKLLNFDIIKLDKLSTMKRRDYKFSTEVEFDIMRHVLETKLDRAVGISSSANTMNERKSLISMFSETKTVTENDNSLVREGFLKKLIGKAR